MDMDIATVNDELARLLVAAGYINVYAFRPVQTLSPPCIYVDWPMNIELNRTFAGMSEADFPIIFVGPSESGIDSRNFISDIIKDAGAVKAAINQSTILKVLINNPAVVDIPGENNSSFIGVKFIAHVRY